MKKENTFPRRHWQRLLIEFLDEKYPKGSPDRGHALVHATLFMLWLEKKKIGFTSKEINKTDTSTENKIPKIVCQNCGKDYNNCKCKNVFGKEKN